MKKLFILSVLALGAVTMNAQITKVGTFTGDLELLTYSNGLYYNTFGQPTEYVAFADSTSSTNIQVSIISLSNCNVYKTINLGKKIGERFNLIGVAVKNFWSNDDKVTFVLSIVNGKTYIYNEDGTEIFNFRSLDLIIVEDVNAYYLIDRIDKDNIVYSMPKYTPTSINNPSAPTRTSSARKVVENGQMYIILDGVKYAVTGTEM